MTIKLNPTLAKQSELLYLAQDDSILYSNFTSDDGSYISQKDGHTNILVSLGTKTPTMRWDRSAEETFVISVPSELTEAILKVFPESMEFTDEQSSEVSEAVMSLVSTALDRSEVESYIYKEGGCFIQWRFWDHAIHTPKTAQSIHLSYDT